MPGLWKRKQNREVVRCRNLNNASVSTLLRFVAFPTAAGVSFTPQQSPLASPTRSIAFGPAGRYSPAILPTLTGLFKNFV
jgi:hypothetical protein